MIIYKATNLINKKCYIGKSEYSIEKRINEHYNRKSNSYFHHSLKKYGKDNFEWSIIKECDNVPLLNILETFMIMVHHTFVDEGGYNLTWGGEGCSGLIHTEETKKKISETHKANTYWLGKINFRRKNAASSSATAGTSRTSPSARACACSSSPAAFPSSRKPSRPRASRTSASSPRRMTPPPPRRSAAPP